MLSQPGSFSCSHKAESLEDLSATVPNFAGQGEGEVLGIISWRTKMTHSRPSPQAELAPRSPSKKIAAALRHLAVVCALLSSTLVVLFPSAASAQTFNAGTGSVTNYDWAALVLEDGGWPVTTN